MGEQFTVAVKEIALTYQKTLKAVGILIQEDMQYIYVNLGGGGVKNEILFYV